MQVVWSVLLVTLLSLKESKSKWQKKTPTWVSYVKKVEGIDNKIDVIELAKHSIRPVISLRKEISDDPEQAFQDLAREVIVQDELVSKYCAKNPTKPTEIYENKYYKLIFTPETFVPDNILIRIKHRVIYTKGNSKWPSTDKDSTFEDIRTLPSFVDTTKATWALTEAKIVVNIPYKFNLNKEWNADCDNNLKTNEMVILVPRVENALWYGIDSKSANDKKESSSDIDLKHISESNKNTLTNTQLKIVPKRNVTNEKEVVVPNDDSFTWEDINDSFENEKIRSNGSKSGQYIHAKTVTAHKKVKPHTEQNELLYNDLAFIFNHSRDTLPKNSLKNDKQNKVSDHVLKEIRPKNSRAPFGKLSIVKTHPVISSTTEDSVVISDQNLLDRIIFVNKSDMEMSYLESNEVDIKPNFTYQILNKDVNVVTKTPRVNSSVNNEYHSVLNNQNQGNIVQNMYKEVVSVDDTFNESSDQNLIDLIFNSGNQSTTLINKIGENAVTESIGFN